MKRPALGTDIVPVADFRANIAAYLDQVASTGRPVILTQRGRSAGAVVSPAMLDALEAERELVHKVLRGLHESQSDNVVEDETMWADIEGHMARRELAAQAPKGKRKARSAP